MTENGVPVPTGVETAGNKSNIELPREIQGWNWGAFFLSWIWGLSHRVWISLLSLVFGFVPLVGWVGVLVMSIVLGLKGNEWAWQSRHFESVEHFKKVQKVWAIWGLVVFVLGAIFMLTMGTVLWKILQEGS
jgi:hypothetical protein